MRAATPPSSPCSTRSPTCPPRKALDKKPLEYAAGDKFSLSYLLTVYSEDKPPEFIRHRCERWEKERK